MEKGNRHKIKYIKDLGLSPHNTVINLNVMLDMTPNNITILEQSECGFTFVERYLSYG